MIHYMIWFSNKNLNTTSVKGVEGHRHALSHHAISQGAAGVGGGQGGTGVQDLRVLLLLGLQPDWLKGASGGEEVAVCNWSHRRQSERPFGQGLKGRVPKAVPLRNGSDGRHVVVRGRGGSLVG